MDAEETTEVRVPFRTEQEPCGVCGVPAGRPCDFERVGGLIRHRFEEMGQAMQSARQASWWAARAGGRR